MFCFRFQVAAVQHGGLGSDGGRVPDGHPGAGEGAGHAYHGRAVQVDPIKPKLKAPGSEQLKPNCDHMLSNVAFKFKLRRYIMDDKIQARIDSQNKILYARQGRNTPPLLTSA
jgi:hypothetical protein